ncbi:MAG TPA: hypothetical protein VK815_14230 [Candidatus Acidoferrales bacterium]|jgi:hypothetical protein|nr:hypothetical protein [Candidatus Acidoferrales bacterium]
MLKKDPNYRQLKPGGAGLFGVSTFWLAPDHLLVVEVSGYVEKYRRFYFRDIQALIVQQTSLRLWWSLGLGACITVLLGILMLVTLGSSSADPATVGVFIAFMLCLGVPLLINILRGPTCTVSVRTAVQTQKIPNLTRRNKAGKLVELLKSAIAAAQEAPPAPAPAAVTPDNPGLSPG